jgi:hypothetical protein
MCFPSNVEARPKRKIHKYIKNLIYIYIHTYVWGERERIRERENMIVIVVRSIGRQEKKRE